MLPKRDHKICDCECFQREIHLGYRYGEGRFGEKDQVLVNLMGLELEESIRKDKEEFTGEGRTVDCEKSQM